MGDFHGLPTRVLSNAHVYLEYLAEAGPRIVRLSVAGGGENLLAEVPDLGWSTPFGEYRVYGGHRLWHAPESMPRTYIPDNLGLTVHEVADGVELRQPKETATGLRKTVTLRLQPDRPVVTLTHRLDNEGAWPIETSPWAITQLRLGGLVVLPQPGCPGDERDLQPNRHLVLWPYTDWEDPRLNLRNDYVLFQARPHLPPCKFGYLNTHGWAGYLWQDLFFVKWFEPQPDWRHPDWNCNVEVYGNDRFVELETVAPLVRLEPGETAVHLEQWRIFTGARAEPGEAGVPGWIRALDLSKAPENS